MEIIFTRFLRVNHDRDGLDLQYFYKVKNGNAHEKKIHIVLSNGAERFWTMDSSKLKEFSEKLFSYVIEYFKQEWISSNSLPTEDEIHLSNDIKIENYPKTNFKLYSLILEP